MLGAIAGDVIGSVFERHAAPGPDPEFQPLFHSQCRFTDDTVLTVAVADWLLNGGDLVDLFKDYARAYPRAGYGGTFARWVNSEDRAPYGSWGNGSAMRVSPVGFAAMNLEDAIGLARATAIVTHDHPEGIRGAEATAAAVFLARTGHEKLSIRAFIESRFGYDLTSTIAVLRPCFTFDVSCQGTVPPALLAFMETSSFEHAVRTAVSLGGDTDTLAAITGGFAQAYYGRLPEPIRAQTEARLDDRLKNVVHAFEKRYMS